MRLGILAALLLSSLAAVAQTPTLPVPVPDGGDAAIFCYIPPYIAFSVRPPESRVCEYQSYRSGAPSAVADLKGLLRDTAHLQTGPVGSLPWAPTIKVVLMAGEKEIGTFRFLANSKALLNWTRREDVAPTTSDALRARKAPFCEVPFTCD